jgi:D-glycero-alpha-D-manno-heptose-7-phosphate kinase
MSKRYFLVRSPYRVSLFGGGTDYPEYFLKNKGAVIGFSIQKYIYLGGLLTNDYVDYKYRLAYSKLETTEKINEIFHPSVREGMKLMKFNSPIDFSFQADLPASSGLGSSSSFSVGFLKLISEIKGEKISKKKLSEKAIFLDRNILNEDVGVQDHLHSAFGGVNKFSFRENKITRKSINLSKQNLIKLEESMMLVHTGKKRSASSIAAEQIKKTKDNKIDNNLKDIYQTVSEAEKLITKFDQNAPKEIGSLLNDYWNIKKTLTKKISADYLDEIYEKGIKMGAYGGKLCGAGGGGFFLFILPKFRRKKFKEFFGEKNCIDFKIDFSGTKRIFKG